MEKVIYPENRDTNIDDTFIGVTLPEKKSMGEKLRSMNGVRASVKTFLLSAILYYVSPHLPYFEHTTKKQEVQANDKQQYPNLDAIYATEDEETNTILDLMSGYGNKQKISKLMRQYGYYNVFPIAEFAKPDKALYEAIRQMNIKYGSPYVTFDKRYNMLGYGKESPAMYTPDHKEHINNFDSVNVVMTPRKEKEPKGIKDSVTNKEIIAINDWQKYLVNRWVAELGHARQMQRDGVRKLSVNVAADIIFNTLQGKVYDDLYTTRGTFEHEAHKIIVPELDEELIRIYIENTDTTKKENRLKISKLYDGFFDRFQDTDEAKRWKE